MIASKQLKGLLAGIAAVALVGTAMAQGNPPNPAVKSAPTGAGQQSSQQTPMGTTGTPTGSGAATTGSTASGSSSTTGSSASSGSTSGGTAMGATSSGATSDTSMASSGGKSKRRMRADRN
jgi:hypothetical protein